MASYLPSTHYYIPRVEQREPNLFTEEYYSSTDTKIYIDGIEQTEIGYPMQQDSVAVLSTFHSRLMNTT